MYCNNDFNVLKEIVHNLLIEYDLEPESVLEIMMNEPQNIYCSSLVGYFYQHGIGCKVDEIKAFEIYSNAITNNQKEIPEQISFDDFKKLNEIVTLYFFSLFL